jgi:hypothetical protein
LFNDKKRMLEEGGVAELEKPASGGKDIATLLIQANQAADEHDKMTDKVDIANMRPRYNGQFPHSAYVHDGVEP